MNREIKFRAWNKEIGYIGRVLDIDFEENELTIKCEDWDLASTYAHTIDKFKLMQYIGLKDNSEKQVEIYEGDILFCKTENYQGTVYFKNGAFMTDATGWGDSLLTDANELEVIGNIYENPELLND